MVPGPTGLGGGEVTSAHLIRHRGRPAARGRGFLHAVQPHPLLAWGPTFVEAFAGSCGLAVALARCGVPSESYEIARDPAEDLLSSSVSSSIRSRISAGRIWGFWIGLTCASWSRARRGRPGGGGWPPPLRGDSPPELFGLPGLSSRDQDRVSLGNKQLNWTLGIIELAISNNLVVVLENPVPSRLWLVPALQALFRKGGCEVVFDHCQFAASARKPTKLWVWNAPLATSLGARCHPVDGCCSASHLPHVSLAGIDPATKRFRTAASSAYPHLFCRKAARMILSTLMCRLHDN